MIDYPLGKEPSDIKPLYDSLAGASGTPASPAVAQAKPSYAGAVKSSVRQAQPAMARPSKTAVPSDRLSGGVVSMWIVQLGLFASAVVKLHQDCKGGRQE